MPHLLALSTQAHAPSTRNSRAGSQVRGRKAMESGEADSNLVCKDTLCLCSVNRDQSELLHTSPPAFPHVDGMSPHLPTTQGCAKIIGLSGEPRASSHPDLLPHSCVWLTASGAGVVAISTSRSSHLPPDWWAGEGGRQGAPELAHPCPWDRAGHTQSPGPRSRVT